MASLALPRSAHMHAALAALLLLCCCSLLSAAPVHAGGAHTGEMLDMSTGTHRATLPSAHKGVDTAGMIKASNAWGSNAATVAGEVMTAKSGLPRRALKQFVGGIVGASAGRGFSGYRAHRIGGG